MSIEIKVTANLILDDKGVPIVSIVKTAGNHSSETHFTLEQARILESEIDAIFCQLEDMDVDPPDESNRNLEGEDL